MANKSSNASATEFGFDFQHNAGIVLMLKFIKSVESVRCEGNFEDVELTLVSKKKIYAQAKALVNPDMHKSIVSKMGDALESLNRADKNGDAEELVFVTNCPNPFNDMASIQSFAIGVPLIAYDELPSTAKEKLESMYVRRGVSFDKRKFKVLTFYFRDGDNKYNIVMQTQGNILMLNVMVYDSKLRITMTRLNHYSLSCQTATYCLTQKRRSRNLIAQFPV